MDITPLFDTIAGTIQQALANISGKASDTIHKYLDKIINAENKIFGKLESVAKNPNRFIQPAMIGKCEQLGFFYPSRNYLAPTQVKKGQKITLPIADAKHLQDTWLVYQGKETIEMKNSNNKYRCLVLSFMEREDGEEKEIIRFFVTDDQNHLPVRLDMFLRFGSAKAYLTGMKGVRSPLTSKVK